MEMIFQLEASYCSFREPVAVAKDGGIELMAYDEALDYWKRWWEKNRGSFKK